MTSTTARRIATTAEYFALDAVHWSTLTAMRQSPKHYRHRRDNDRADTLTLAKGRAAHTAVFEPDRFPVEYAVYSDGDRRGKRWEAFKEAHEGRTILKAEEYAACLAMRDAVRAHPVASLYLQRGEAEIGIAWTDEATKLLCKGRLDWVPHEFAPRRAVVDLKTTTRLTAYQFGVTAARLGYHCQLAHYRAGWAALTGDLLPCVLIAVESVPPHDVAVFEVDEDALYAGTEEVGELLAMVAECQRVGQWPGAHPEQEVLRLPAWIFGDDEEENAPAAVADPF